MQRTLTCADVAFVSETRLSASDDFHLHAIGDKRVICNEYATTAHGTSRTGGAMLQCKRTLAHTHAQNMATTPGINILTAVLHLPGHVPIRVIGVYRSPRSNTVRPLLNELEPLVPSSNADPVVIFGDFNVDYNDCTTMSRDLTTFMAARGCTQHISTPTSRGGALIDNIWTNTAVLTSGIVVSYCSDHEVVWAAITLRECTTDNMQTD